MLKESNQCIISDQPELIGGRKRKKFACHLNTSQGINGRNKYRKYPNLVHTQAEIISDPNYLVRILFER